MSEYRIERDINPFEIVDEYTKRISRVIDEQTLANVENQLAEYGYVKVVRCRDCKYLKPRDEECGGRNWCKRMSFEATPDGFCAWGERRSE